MWLDQTRLPPSPMAQRFSKKLHQRAMQNNFKRTCLTWSRGQIPLANFNFSKCKAQCITGKLKPVIFLYHMAGSQVEAVSAEKDLGVYITDNLTWNKHVNEQSAKASMLLGYLSIFFFFIFCKLWDHWNWLTTVVASLPN